MLRAEKADVIERMKALFAESDVLIVSHYKGMTVAQDQVLRSKLREAGAGYRVTSNRLTKIALGDSVFAPLADMMTGPTAITYSRDPVAAAKAVLAYAKTNDKFQIIGGALPGQAFDAKGVEDLSKMPSIDELRAKILGMLVTPATRIASILPKPATELVRMLNAPAQAMVGVLAAQGAKTEG